MEESPSVHGSVVHDDNRPRDRNQRHAPENVTNGVSLVVAKARELIDLGLGRASRRRTEVRHAETSPMSGAELSIVVVALVVNLSILDVISHHLEKTLSVIW
jgi:hypothetical protein